jgi:hypothetical protein
MPDQDWKAHAESLTEGALILRLKSAENDFVERKPRGQKGEWLTNRGCIRQFGTRPQFNLGAAAVKPIEKMTAADRSEGGSSGR